LTALAVQGRDVKLSEDRIEGYRHFVNKIWNAARLVLMNTEDFSLDGLDRNELPLELSDRWILSRLNQTAESVTTSLSGYRFNEAAQTLYDFVWHQYCDWYLELIKPRLYGDDPVGRRTVQYVALQALDGLLRLLHPFMPFLTEEIWQQVKTSVGAKEESITMASWPVSEGALHCPESEQDMELIQKVIMAIRNMRGDMNVPPSKQVRVIISGDGQQSLEKVERFQEHVLRLAKVESLELGQDLARPRQALSALVDGLQMYLPLEGLVDVELEAKRLRKEIGRLEGLLRDCQTKLANQDFLSRAPESVLQGVRKKRDDYAANLEKLRRNLSAVSDA
jgi:valyl-tRNA synthetase